MHQLRLIETTVSTEQASKETYFFQEGYDKKTASVGKRNKEVGLGYGKET